MTQTVYDAAGGAATMLALAHAWHARVLTDPIVSHAFSHGFRDDHSERLAAYWGEALGGPPAFSAGLGTETGVVRIHSGNGEHHEMDARSVACFVGALDDVGLSGAVRDTLLAYFTWGVKYMDHYPDSPDDVPDGLRLPQWSWDGLIERPG